MEYLAIHWPILIYLGLAFLIAAVCVYASITSGCHSSRRDFYEAMDRESEVKREIEKLPVFLRKQAGGNWERST